MRTWLRLASGWTSSDSSRVSKMSSAFAGEPKIASDVSRGGTCDVF